MNNITVAQKPGEEVPAQVIAASIVKIGDAAEAMARSGLTLKAQLILLSALSGETRKTCQQVLWALQNLKKEFIVAPKGTTK